jgi:hypothetical protein
MSTRIESIKRLVPQSRHEAFWIGMMPGLIASWAYVICGGSTWLSVPVWAQVVFYPGLFVGMSSYHFFGSMTLALLTGTVSVGLFYGFLLMAVFSIWNVGAKRSKVILAVLGIMTLIAGLIFGGHLLSSSGADCLAQDYSLSITSEPAGAAVYPVSHQGQPAALGVTPLVLKGSYTIGRDGLGWGFSGQGINLKSTDKETLVVFSCVVIKDGVVCKDQSPILATIPKNMTRPAQVPSKFQYHAKFPDVRPSDAKQVGKAILVDGTFYDVNPAALKMLEGVYTIDIKRIQ